MTTLIATTLAVLVKERVRRWQFVNCQTLAYAQIYVIIQKIKLTVKSHFSTAKKQTLTKQLNYDILNC